MSNHRIAGSLLLLGLLAGCGTDSVEAPPPPPPVVVAPAEDAFGANFGAAFRADPNSTPRTPADGDIIALTFTENPRAVG